MSLRTRTLAAIFLALAAGAISIYALIQLTLGRDVAQLNDSLTEEGLKRAVITIRGIETELKGHAIDYAAWDDTYAWLADLNPAYPKANLVPDTFSNLNLQLLLVYDAQGKLVYHRYFDPLDRREIELPAGVSGLFRPDDPLLHGQTPADAKAGLISLEGRLAVVSLSPILTSANNGPSRGTWVWGRMLNSALIEHISQLSGTSFQLERGTISDSPGAKWLGSGIAPCGHSFVKLESGGATYMAAQLADISGKPLAVAKVRMPRRMEQTSRRFTLLLAGILLAVSLVLAYAVMARIDSDVLKPLAGLCQDLGAIQPGQALARRVRVAGSGELVGLGQSINATLAQLETAYTSLEQTNSELSSSERKYRQLFELAQEGIALVDKHDCFTMVNPAYCSALGYTADELLGTSLLNYVVPAQHDLIHANTEKRRLGLTSTYETHFVTRSGEIKEFLATVGPLLDGKGAYQGAIGFITDISEHKQTQQRLADIQRLESLGVLAGGIAHDFNNLLVSILGNAQVALQEVALPESQRLLLNNIVAASQRAAELTRQMLAFSGRGHFVVQPANLNLLVSEISLLARAAVPKSAAIETKLAPVLQAVQADTAQLHQVVLNLVINGAEALGGEPGTVTISTGMLDATADDLQSPYMPVELPAGRYAYLEVADTGRGMDSETLHKLFEPFFSTKAPGRGLGLSAVLGIVRGHNGTLTVDSSPAGTVFRVLLPALDLPAPEPESEIEAAPTATVVPADIPAGDKYVLVVDDEEGVREVMQRMLESRDIPVLQAAGGEDALALLRGDGQQIGLLLLDLTMPRRDGIATLIALREFNDTLPVVLMSGYSASELTRRCAGLNVAAFLTKPFSPRELLETVTPLLAAEQVQRG